MSHSPEVSAAQSAGQQEDSVRRARHDLRGPMVNIQGFSSELKYAFECFAALLSHHQDDLPLDFCDRATKLLHDDVIPCLGFLDSAVVQLDERINTVGRQLAAAVINKGIGDYR